MGFLFPWVQIRKGRIPTREDLDCMRAIVMEAMQVLPDIVAASVYGSVLRGDHSSRSDLDVVIVCRNNRLLEVQALVDILSDQAVTRNIVMSVHLHRVSDARAGRHSFGPSYRSTMWQLVREGHAKGYPHEWFRSPHVTIREEMEFRLQSKTELMKQQAARFFTTVGDNPTLKNVRLWLNQSYQNGERPFHFYMGFARWMLWWKHQKLLNDGKESVIHAFLSEKSFGSLHTDFKTLLALDVAYDFLLDDVREGRMSSKQYHERVAQMVTEVFVVTKRLLMRARILMRRAMKTIPRLDLAA